MAGWNITAANTQWIITRAHQMGLITYGEFVSTPYKVGIEAGVDALLHMGRYELGVIPDELQRRWWRIPTGSAANTAYDYAEHLPPTDPHFREYCAFPRLASRGADAHVQHVLSAPAGASQSVEGAGGAVLDPAHMFIPSDPATGELIYPLPSWARHLPGDDAALDGRRAATRRRTSRPCACGASIRPSSPPTRITWRPRARR